MKAAWCNSLRSACKFPQIIAPSFIPGASRLDEPWGEQNLSLANTVSDTRPDPEEAYRKRQIAKRLAHATSRLSFTCYEPLG
jgi:hypothetical protein